MEAYLTGKTQKRHPLTQKQAANIIASQISKGHLSVDMLKDPEMRGAFDFEVLGANPNNALVNVDDWEEPDYDETDLKTDQL
jgi:hypothetical protein